MAAKTFSNIAKFNPYHDSKGRFASSDSATSYTYAPGKSTAHDKAIQREKEKAEAEKGFSGTLYHGSPNKDIEEFDMSRAGKNTSSGEKLLFFTDSKQLADDFSYERLDGSGKFFQRRGEKGRVYEVDVKMKNPLDFRKLTDADIDNILKLDSDGILDRDMVKQLANSNHQLLKAGLTLTADSLSELGYDGLIANMGKAGHNALEYAVVDSKQAKIRKSAVAKSFDEILKFNPYHDSLGRFASADSATSFTYRTKDPDKQFMADNAIAREKERQAGGANPKSDADSPQMKSIHEVEDKIRHQNYESSVVVDKDGNVVFFKDGGENSVSFTRLECQQMKDNILTHNHPRCSMFSAEDIQCFERNEMEGIRATNRDGITYVIKRGEGYTRADGQVFHFEYNINHSLARQTAQRELDARGFQRKIARGEISIEDANKEFGKVVNREMIDFCEKKAPEYNLEFSVEKRSVTKSAGFSISKNDTTTGEDVIVLDQKTNDQDDAAFNEWLNRATMNKAAPKSVLFIGLKINGANDLAIDGGEDPEDFHVTLAYGHFDPRGDEDDTAVRVQSAIKDIRDLIPDTIRFDAIDRFTASESSDGKDVIYARVAAGQLEEAHEALLKALKKQGIKLEGTFPEYKPHMTLAYIDPGEKHDLSEIDASGTTTKVMIGYGEESTHENDYTIKKIDDDKRLVFGWASVSVTVDGELLEDRQHDLIDPEDLEESAYEFVLNFRDTGELHNPNLRKKGKLVESCVFTVEKQKAMGIPEGSLPVGWWVGFKITDDDAWEKVKNGTYKMFSVEGKANRIPVEKAAPSISKSDPARFVEIEEFP